MSFLTSDKRIAKDPINVKAVIDSKAQVVICRDNSMLPEFWGAAFVMGQGKIQELLDRNAGPIFIQITNHCGEHVRIVKEHFTRRIQGDRESGTDT